MYFIVIILLCFISINIINSIAYYLVLLNSDVISMENEKIRDLDIEVNLDDIKKAANDYGINEAEFLIVLTVSNNYKIDNSCLSKLDKSSFIKKRNILINKHPKDFQVLKRFYTGILNDIEYFPVAKSTSEKRKFVSYINSWGSERTYGGKRRHEGTDIMADDNVTGIYPVVSASCGTIINMGWLELGGYRIGILSDNGIYYYYAHLESFEASLKEGDTVKAGQLIGFMGNTGYSKVEGTSGKFDVHLHFGIYYSDADREISYNPYWILESQFQSNKMLYYTY